MKQVRTLPSYLLMTNYILTSRPRSSKNSLFLQSFSSQYSMHFSFLTCMLMRRPPSPPSLGHPSSHEQDSVACVTIYHTVSRFSRGAMSYYNDLELLLPSGELSLLGSVVNGESSVHPLSMSDCQTSYVSQCFSTFVRPRPGKFFFP